MVLKAASYALQFYIGTDPIVVSRLPYSVGRYREAGEDPSSADPDLLIDDPVPYRLSPIHFVLEDDDGSLCVRDCYTELGTIVNGRSLGRDFPTETMTLEVGENEIIAGGESSPYRFIIKVEA